LNTFSEENIDRIRLLAQNTRTKHRAMEWGVPPEYLIKKEGLDYEEYNLNTNGFRAKVTATIKNLVKIIKAAIIPRERTILVDVDLHYAKKPFGQSHELGHNTIPEHREILYVCSEYDLNPQTRDEMEFEANVFASELIFPSPLMESIYKNYPLSMDTILQVKDLSKGSIHSAAIKYVAGAHQECCLLLLKRDQDEQGNDGLRLTKQIPSPPWWEKYGKLLQDDQFFPPQHNLSLVVFSGTFDDIVKNVLRVC
jgi:hypothetical protein